MKFSAIIVAVTALIAPAVAYDKKILNADGTLSMVIYVNDEPGPLATPLDTSHKSRRQVAGSNDCSLVGEACTFENYADVCCAGETYNSYACVFVDGDVTNGTCL